MDNKTKEEQQKQRKKMEEYQVSCINKHCESQKLQLLLITSENYIDEEHPEFDIGLQHELKLLCMSCGLVFNFHLSQGGRLVEIG